MSLGVRLQVRITTRHRTHRLGNHRVPLLYTRLIFDGAFTLTLPAEYLRIVCLRIVYFQILVAHCL
jgi:hypothetical protein